MIDSGVFGLYGSAPGRMPPPPSPSPGDEIEPPTNSVATGSLSSLFTRTSPATNVWMSPVTNTTSSIFLRWMCCSSSCRSRG